MREILKVILPAIGTGLFVYGVGMAGVIAYDKLFSRKKLKKSRNTESDSGPADNPPPMRDIQCEVCGYKFIPYNDNRYTVVGKHNYGRFPDSGFIFTVRSSILFCSFGYYFNNCNDCSRNGCNSHR